MGNYVGAATLLEGDERLADVRVTLGTTDALAEHWVGVVKGLDGVELDGHEVTVQLPTGLSSKATVHIDLTHDEPIIRLVGTGPSPI